MVKSVEEKIKHCRKCGQKTRHARNVNTTGAAMFLVHLFLTVVTAGVWLVLLVIWLILTKKIGGWKCSNCMAAKLDPKAQV